VPNRIKNIMANTKSVMRKKLRKKGPGKKKASQKAVKLVAQPAAAKLMVLETVSSYATHPGFEELEEQIDECLSMAKALDRESLADVINLLRRARNQVVWKLGQ
jgi:hypothetical protein